MDKSTLVRVRGVTAMLVYQSGCIPNYTKFKNFELPFRGIKPKIDKLTNSTQLYPSLESKKSWLLFRGDLWSRDLLVKTIYYRLTKV